MPTARTAVLFESTALTFVVPIPTFAVVLIPALFVCHTLNAVHLTHQRLHQPIADYHHHCNIILVDPVSLSHHKSPSFGLDGASSDITTVSLPPEVSTH